MAQSGRPEQVALAVFSMWPPLLPEVWLVFEVKRFRGRTRERAVAMVVMVATIVEVVVVAVVIVGRGGWRETRHTKEIVMEKIQPSGHRLHEIKGHQLGHVKMFGEWRPAATPMLPRNMMRVPKVSTATICLCR